MRFDPIRGVRYRRAVHGDGTGFDQGFDAASGKVVDVVRQNAIQAAVAIGLGGGVAVKAWFSHKWLEFFRVSWRRTSIETIVRKISELPICKR